MTRFVRLSALTAAVLLCLSAIVSAQTAPASASTKLKDEMRMPWQRGDENFLRLWLVAGPFPCGLATDCLVSQGGAQGGEAGVQPTDGLELKRADGTTVKWHSQKSWGDVVAFDDLAEPKDGAVGYAFTKVTRPKAGKALLSVGSGDGIRVWLNGKLVLSKDGLRSLTADEDQVEVGMNAGENALLVKVSARKAFSARVLEAGTVVARKAEIGPSIVKYLADGFTLKTDTGAERADAEAVKVEVIQPGGKVVFTTTAARGATVKVNAKNWPDGPYEVRCSTHTFAGLLYATHLPWYKGESLAEARELAATAAKADASTPEGFTLKMLAEMVDDRLGSKLSEAQGNPWLKIHSPLMEYDEMMLERKGQTGRIRPDGFVRMAYRDEVDGSPQYCRAYLPVDYDPAKKWPLVIQMHGYNPANPVYVRWWAADERHAGVDTEFSNHQEVIYMEPHGRGNVQYLGMGDSDVMHAIAEAKRLFNVDEDRVYLTGDSMGGWGTWNVSSRHPDLFAAIAPVFGGVDYHSTMSEEDLAKLSPLERFLNEKQSSWSMADSLLNIPIFVHHGDADKSVNVEFSRWAVRMLQRWGYDVRYQEYPGRIHEALESQNGDMSIEWFLQHRRNPNPRHVRIRSAELRNAKAYWAHVLQAASPLAFMVVDAEVVDRNLIRLDTENVLDIELSPSAVLVNPDKPVKVVWNGKAYEMSLQSGKLRLTSGEYKPAALHKNERLPGSTADFTVTPFAIVVGTISKDPEMVALCRQKADTVIGGWRDWQKQEPRVFKDTEIKDADMAKYSLLLIGGPEANRVTAKLAGKLPLQISTDSIFIDGKAFPVKDAAVQMIYPNPLNPERYVWIAAGTSTDGMYFTDLDLQNRYDWDYIVMDGRLPASKQSATWQQTRVVSGMFDYNWRYSDSLAQTGDADIRAQGRQRHRPNPNLAVDPKVLDTYVGRYQIADGPLVEVFRDGKRLMAKQQGESDMELVPETETSYYIVKHNVWLSFVRDAAGKITGLTGYSNGDFEGKKLD
ncbi:MAG: prolyl oligopeptidase family serine peptidase [Terriglobales bacterium]